MIGLRDCSLSTDCICRAALRAAEAALAEGQQELERREAETKKLASSFASLQDRLEEEAHQLESEASVLAEKQKREKEEEGQLESTAADARKAAEDCQEQVQYSTS